MQTLRETFISALLHGRLWLRRLRRSFSANPISRGKRLSHPVFYDDASDARSDNFQHSISRRQRHSPAALPAVLPDPEPLPGKAVAWLLFAVSLVVRGWAIDFPNSVVFDEVHFLRFVKAYFNGQYFFDIHPPLGKLVLLFVAKLFGGPLTLKFEMNGEPFGDQVYAPLRWTSAIFGSGLAPVTYLICRELGLSVPASLVPATAFVFDHLAVVESRLALLDAQLMFFMALCLLFALKLWGARKGTLARQRYVLGTALAGVCAIGVKWTAVATPGLVALVSLCGWPFPGQGRLQWSEMVTAGVVAFTVYTLLFCVHFALLPLSGQGDAFMSKSFQSSLKGSHLHVNGSAGPGFLRNFLYLNRRMYSANAHITRRHRWESKWYQWIINQQGLLYFNELEENTKRVQKIYLIVNPAVSVITIVSLLAFVTILFIEYLPKKRSGRLAATSRLPAFVARGSFLFFGFVVNILPFVAVARCTFLYHYLPPLFYALLGTANLVDLIPQARTQRVVSGLFFVALLITFGIWSPWIYGTALERTGHRRLRLYTKGWS